MTRTPAALGPVTGLTARLADGSPVHVHLGADHRGVVRVTAVEAATEPSAHGHEPGWLDLRDHVLCAAAADPHAHLDKALTWNILQPPFGDLRTAVRTWHDGSFRLDEESFRRRSHDAAVRMLRNGITAVRTHVDVLPNGDPVRAVRAVDETRRRLAGVVDIQIAVLVTPGISLDAARAALDAGADLVGGAPHIADDPIAEVDRLVDLAESCGVGIDLHVDEFTAGDSFTLGRFAERVAHWPASLTRTAGHCCRLATAPPDVVAELATAVRDAGIGMVTLPITNLYLQGRGGDAAGPRGIAPLGRLRAAGLTLAAGGDNIRDPFNPMGRADPLETAALLVTAAHQEPGAALDMVTNAARAVMGLEPAGPHVGARADLLAVHGDTLTDAIAAAPADRVVLVNGSVVSIGRTEWQSVVSTEAPAGQVVFS